MSEVVNEAIFFQRIGVLWLIESSGMVSWRRQPVIWGVGEVQGFGVSLQKGEWDKRKIKLAVFCVSFWVLCKSLTDCSSRRLMANSVLTAPADRR